MAESSEPRALSAALSGPTFVTRSGGSVMRAANRHVERWAPEATAARHGSLRNLGFVDRLVSPWIDAAQRSASLRMFSQYRKGVAEREGSPVSWVFPRPWYQDELDWMAAAKQSGSAPRDAAPQMLTTRGTYVSPASAAMRQSIVPQAMYEFVAPSLSIARPQVADNVTSERMYSPLVPFAAAQAAHVMSHAVAPLVGDGGASRMSPGLRAVLTTMLERAARTPVAEAAPTRAASIAPEMVTPPAPRPTSPDGESTLFESRAQQVIADMTAQRARVVELQRVAQATADREYHARATADAAARASAAPAAAAAPAETHVAQVDAAAEQQRIEQRVAARIAERERSRTSVDSTQAERQRAVIEQKIATAQRAQATATSARLHEQARTAALADARAATASAQVSAQTQAAAAAVAAASVRREEAATESRVPAEIAAALAALPPELAGYIGRRPDRSVQAIAEVSEALRAVELIAHGAARGHSLESTRGPRLAMPAGLGGLVATVERATPMPFADPGRAMAQPIGDATRAQRTTRVPAMSWLAGPGGMTASGGAPSAISQAASSTPAGIQHVAWADRWLARFAGARPRSLDAMTIASATPELRLAALAAAAPDRAFVAPLLDAAAGDGRRADRRGGSAQAGSVAANAPAMTQAQPVDERVTRYADDAETPDEVFAAISQAATRSRPSARAAQIAGIAAPTEHAAVNAPAGMQRDTYADYVASVPPSSPGAGMSAQLASSPFAPALHHLLALPSMPSFDVRALFGSGLAASFLAGLLEPDAKEMAIAPAAPAWASWGDERVQAGQSMGDTVSPNRIISDFDGSLVAPTPEGFIVERIAAEPSVDAQPSYSPAAAAAAIAPLTTLRTALLSWDVEQRSLAGGPIETRFDVPTITQMTTGSYGSTVAQSLVDSMRMPMLGDAFGMAGALGGSDLAEAGVSMTAPGMIADRAQAWSVAQERSSSDLSYDFVPPELVLAAKVYGLGPAEAAQAARLAIAGPGQLAAMASAVDRTFVQALAIEREQAAGRASGSKSAEASALAGTAPEMGDFVAPAGRPEGRAPIEARGGAHGAAFGVDRRMPRGAFLWPSATVSALGLQAPSPDGEQSMSVAALELLAAQTVAELGTYASISGDKMDPALADVLGSQGFATGTGTMPRMGAGTGTMPRMGAEASTAGEDDVVASAAAMVPTARRSKFEALYLALGQSPTGRQWSPAARAARALALAGRGDDQMSARERASIAWDVLPAVYAAADAGDGQRDERNYVAGEYVAPGSSASTGTAAARASQRRAELREAGFVEMRPGLGSLSGRAGEALGSYVTSQPGQPGSPGSTSTSSTREMRGALSRVPTAAPELVTGRPAGRHGGGEVEIPAWFEAAARKMFSERGGASGVSADISLAELTLVQTAPSAAIAASSRSLPSAMPMPPANQHDERPHDHKEEHRIDTEKVANDVYRHIQSLMDSARARNGEPYL